MQTAAQIIIHQQQEEHRRQGTFGKTHVSLDDVKEYDQIDHIYNRPDTYLGSAEKAIRTSRVFQVDGKIVQREITHPRAMEQTYYEILGNAGDIVWKSKEHGHDPKHVEIQMNAQWCSVKNYGMYITHDIKENGMSMVEWLFGVFMVSTNYDDTKKRFNIGRNGYGAKLTNVMSNMFIVRSVDPGRKQLCTVVWRNHMKEHDPPVYQPYNGEAFTEIQFSLDFQRFGYNEYDEEAISIYAALAAEMSFAAEVPVKFNTYSFNVKNIKDYANYYFDLSTHGHLMYTDPQGSYDICLIDTPNEAIRHSIVNGILTSRGGVHVDEAYREILRCINSSMEKHIEGVKLTIKDISSHVSVFLNCRLPNPTFDGQTKDYLSKPTPKIDIPEKTMKKIDKWNLIQEIYKTIQQRQLNKLKKTDGRKKGGKHVSFSENTSFEDANLAGKSKDTVLVLCEGKSGVGFYTTWIDNIPNNRGRDYYGILPLRGKFLNVLKASFTQILENKEIMQFKGAMGLNEGDDTLDLKILNKLRYQTILIVPDADDDGSHILMLIISFICSRFPGLLVHKRVKYLRTPIVYMRKSGTTHICYTSKAFEEWKERTPNWNTWTINYFKGLGSYEDSHINAEYSRPKIVTFHLDEDSVKKIAMAFTNENIKQRKEWFINWMNTVSPNLETYTDLTVGQFIDYEFPAYAMESIYRAIPDIYSGFKESQQKIWYSANKKLGKKNTSSQIKVAQLSGHVAYIADYKHGENCLSDTTIYMAFNFVGTNNMPYFIGKGSFGNRYNGKNGVAQSRYIHVSLPWWRNLIYRREDINIMKPLPLNEGKCPGYDRYYPILPMHIINGLHGIATTISTHIPPHHPLDIAFWFEQRILHHIQPDAGHVIPQIHPYHHGFQGNIRLRGNQYITTGIYECVDDKIIVSELPIGMSGEDYRDHLLELEEKDILEFDNHSKKNTVKFIIRKYKGNINHRELKLIRQYSYNNMTVIVPKGDSFITKTYNNLQDMLEEFFQIRLVKYAERIQIMISKLLEAIDEYNQRLRFIRAVNAGQIVIIKRKKEELHADMIKLNFDIKILKKINSDEYTDENIVQVMADIQKLEDELQALRKTHPGEIWYKDIQEFINEYTKKEKVPRTTFGNYHRANVQIEPPKDSNTPDITIIE